MTTNLRLLALGTFLALVGILLVASFQFVDNHRWYWNAAPLYCVIVVLAAASGSFLIAHSMARNGERRLWLLIPSGILGLAWVASGIVAFGLAFPAMNYFSGDADISWNNYYGDYVLGAYNIRLLQIAVIAGLPGGFIVGKALRKGIVHS